MMCHICNSCFHLMKFESFIVCRWFILDVALLLCVLASQQKGNKRKLGAKTK